MKSTRNHFKECPCVVCTEQRARRTCVAVVLAFLVLAVGGLILLSGCSLPGRRGSIKAGPVAVQGVANAGTPAMLATDEEGESIEIPAGSELLITETAAIEARPATSTAPAIEARPAVKETALVFPGTSHWRRNRATVRADTGTIDTTVAKHSLDIAERRWLLWAAIGCGVGGLVVRSMLPTWPSLSNGLLLAAVAAGVSWKLAEVPAWLWLGIIAVVALIIAGYKRREWDKDGDGIPDALQSKIENPKSKNQS